MRKLSVCAAVLALFAGTAGMFRSERAAGSSSSDFAMLHSKASFRDGLYLGRLAAQQGGPMHIASGRWATAADRQLFVAGFQHGYRELAATRASLASGHEAQ
jgi:hypothetical protein